MYISCLVQVGNSLEGTTRAVPSEEKSHSCLHEGHAGLPENAQQCAAAATIPAKQRKTLCVLKGSLKEFLTDVCAMNE